MNHNTLGNYYQVNFALCQHHKWSITEIEDMYVWERDIYTKFLTDYLEEMKEKRRQAEAR